jgi:alkylated DNA repair dioxygenase AlkB
MTATITERDRGGALENPHWRRFPLPGADVRLTRFCTAAAAQAWFARLHAEIPWQQHRLKIFGREVDSPRLSCWIGDAQAVYTYSHTRFEPQPWTPALRELRDALSRICGEVYNSVLCNLYRDGHDAMGWHSDSEPELGDAPVIASLSFGATRRFRLRHKRDPALRADIALESGSLLLMAGATQRNYRHDLPRTAREVGPRINLTFRRIVVARNA